MDAAEARARGGIVTSEAFAGSVAHLARAARSRGLVQLLPGAWAAATQPVTPALLIAAMRVNARPDEVVMGDGAL